MKRNIALVVISIFMAVWSTSALAAKINPINYTIWSNVFADAKWQLGDTGDTDDVCEYSSDCSDLFNSGTGYKRYIWAESSDNNRLTFSTNGSQARLWRSELRFLDNFAKSSTITMSGRIGYWAGRSTSDGITVAQLHMEDAEGPPARLEIIDEDYFQVTFRNSDDCTSNCWTERTFSTSTSGWKNFSLYLNNYYINVTVAGQTRTYKLTTEWSASGDYYWKTGLYLQDAGTAYTAYRNLYW